MKSNEFYNLTVEANLQGMSIEEILRDEIEVPRKMLHTWRMAKNVLLNGEVPLWSKKVEIGDVVSLPIYIAEENDVTPYSFPIEVVYEDDDILIVNKTSNMKVHPDSNNDTKTLANVVSHYFMKKNIQTKPRHINRLDMDTSGLVLFAKNAFIGAKLDEMLAERSIKRTYAAIVCGSVNEQSFTINEPIARDRHANKMRVAKSGQNAVTHVEVIKYNAYATQIRCTLETGRTHQIRVHLSHKGHPLVNDTLYGGRKMRWYKGNGQALHAYKMEFVHPLTKEPIRAKSKIPFSV